LNSCRFWANSPAFGGDGAPRRRKIQSSMARQHTGDSSLRGTEAEQLAAGYLQARGLELLARNLRCRAGEIDLVCLEGELLAIVEVRQRSALDFGGALASVTTLKQRRIIRAARFFLRCRPQWRNRAIRFDVLAVQGSPQGAHDIIWVKDAFRAT
jgi:putative endonuclease